MPLPIGLENTTDHSAEAVEALSAEAVDEQMKRDGFPELELLWKRFRRMNLEVDQLDDEQIRRLRNRHVEPLFGRPRAVMCGLLLLAAITIYYCAPRAHGATGMVYFTVLCGLYFLSVPFLAVMLLTWLQRRIVYPLDTIMALDTAFMLTRANYRRVVENTKEAKSISDILSAAGVNSRWDDPSYHATYEKREDGVREVESPRGLPFVLFALRAFVGQKDETRREFVAGRYTPYLTAGKRSVTEFFARHQTDAQQLKAGTLDMAAAIALLRSLREYVAEGSAGMTTLDEFIEAAVNGTFLTAGQLRAEIWQRNPWVDLTHQQEFYSSASLRGVHWMGRSTKGRLGTFGYLRNKAISALDLRSRRKRLVRCRLVATLSLPDKCPILFVDGVEGTNAVQPEVVERAVEDYAHRSGYRFVAYNARVHNQIPRRFLDYLVSRGDRARQLALTIVTPEQREYLDAFGAPLEPFEYAFPVSQVLAYVRSVQPDPVSLPGDEPSARHLVYQGVRMNCLWIVLTLSLLLATMIVIHSEPLLLAVFAPLIAVGLWLHFRYQYKSLRAVAEN